MQNGACEDETLPPDTYVAETDAPTEPATETPVTEAPATDAATEAVTEAPTDAASATEGETESGGDGGCASVLSVVPMLLVCLAGAAVCKRKQ